MKKIIAVAISAIFLLTSCSQEKSEPVKGIKVSKQNILIENVAADMPSLDPQQGGDTSSSRVIADLFEGLVAYDQHATIVAAGAVSWNVSSDGKKYTFHLQKNAKWTNGDDVTANDYVYSYRRAVTPDTLTRYYATYFNPIVNAKEIQDGKAKPETLGVIAKDKYTLEINLATPNPTFIDALTLNAFLPINHNTVEKYGDAWAGQPSTIISNGPYKLVKWVHNGFAEADKNEYYWDKDNVSIAKARYVMITDTSSDLQNYSAGYTGITFSSLPSNSSEWYANKFPEQYHSYPVLSQQYYIFNLRNEKLKDPRVRKALSMTIDRDAITKGALKQGQDPSYLVIPESISDSRYKNLAKDVPGFGWVDENMTDRIQQARKLLAEAGYTKENPLTITLKFNTSDSNRDIAMILQAMWIEYFDGVVQVDLFNEDWKVYLDSLKKGNFDIARMAWVADFNEPNTYTEMYTCNSDNNYGDYCNKEADKIYYESIRTNDKKDFYKKQRELIIKQSADYPMIALYTAPYNRLVQEYVKGFDSKHNVMGRHTTKELSINHS